MDKLLTVKEACDLLQVSKPTLYGLIKSKKIQARKIGRSWRIAEKSLQIES